MLYKFETPIEGAYHCALFHAQRAVELTNEQDTFSLEHLLLLNIGGISNMLHPTIKQFSHHDNNSTCQLEGFEFYAKSVLRCPCLNKSVDLQ
ncbi:hypothetical protein LSP03_41130 [Lysinibacillus sphaericus]|nr:hypothetical protein LSP03_41130 [Lysinibacillus sphaericus]